MRHDTSTPYSYPPTPAPADDSEQPAPVTPSEPPTTSEQPTPTAPSNTPSAPFPDAEPPALPNSDLGPMYAEAAQRLLYDASRVHPFAAPPSAHPLKPSDAILKAYKDKITVAHRILFGKAPP